MNSMTDSKRRSEGCYKAVQSTALTAGICVSVRTTPVYADLAPIILNLETVGPNRLGVGFQERHPLIRLTDTEQLAEVAREDTLELDTISSAIPVPITDIDQDSLVSEQLAPRTCDGIGNVGSLVQI